MVLVMQWQLLLATEWKLHWHVYCWKIGWWFFEISQNVKQCSCRLFCCIQCLCSCMNACPGMFYDGKKVSAGWKTTNHYPVQVKDLTRSAVTGPYGTIQQLGTTTSTNWGFIRVNINDYCIVRWDDEQAPGNMEKLILGKQMLFAKQMLAKDGAFKPCVKMVSGTSLNKFTSCGCVCSIYTGEYNVLPCTTHYFRKYVVPPFCWVVWYSIIFLIIY